MKRFLSLLLASCLLFSVTACKKTEPVKETERAQEETTVPVTAAPETETAKETEPVTEASETEPATIAAAGTGQEEETLYPHPFTTETNTGYVTEEYRRVITLVRTGIHLNEEEAARYPELSAAFDQYNQESGNIDDVFRELKGIYQSMKEDGSWDAYDFDGMCLSDEEYLTCMRADQKVTSFLCNCSSYWGGVHGDYAFYGLNFDTEEGKRLRITDVVKDSDAFFHRVDEEIEKNYEDYYDLFESPYDYLKKADPEDPYSISWVMDNEGVTVYFNPYAIGWYALGALSATIPFEGSEDLFEEKYRECREEYVIPLNGYFPVMIDVNGDGKPEEVSVTEELTGEDEYSYRIYTVRAGNRSVKVDDWSYRETGYVVKKNGKYYLYLFEVSDNDYSILRVIDLATMDYDEEYSPNVSLSITADWNRYMKYEETENGFSSTYPQAAFTDPDCFVMDTHTNLLSTLTGKKTYHVGKNGLPETGDLLYDVSGTDHVLVLKTDLECGIVDEDGKESGKTTLPEGTCVRLLRTDDETFAEVCTVPAELVHVVTEDGWTMVFTEDLPPVDDAALVYRITEDKTGWPYRVGGVPEEEAFDGIVYAG